MLGKPVFEARCEFTSLVAPLFSPFAQRMVIVNAARLRLTARAAALALDLADSAPCVSTVVARLIFLSLFPHDLLVLNYGERRGRIRVRGADLFASERPNPFWNEHKTLLSSVSNFLIGHTTRAQTDGVLFCLDHAFEMLLKAVVFEKTGRIRNKREKKNYGLQKCLNIYESTLNVIDR